MKMDNKKKSKNDDTESLSQYVFIHADCEHVIIEYPQLVTGMVLTYASAIEFAEAILHYAMIVDQKYNPKIPKLRH